MYTEEEAREKWCPHRARMVWRDEYDVEHIHMYGLIKPGREGV